MALTCQQGWPEPLIKEREKCEEEPLKNNGRITKRNICTIPAVREVCKFPGCGWDFKLKSLGFGDAAASTPSPQCMVMD